MDTRAAFSWALVAVLATIAWLLVRPFLSWLLATGLLAFVLRPVHRRLEGRVGSRPAAGLLVVLVLLVLFVPVALGVNAVLTEGTVLLEGVSRAEVLGRLQRVLERYTGVAVPVQSLASQGAERLQEYVSRRTTSFLGAGLHAFLGFLLLTFVLYFLLTDGESFLAWLRRVTPLEPAVREDLFTSANDLTWAVLKGHVLVAAVQGLVAGISLFVTGVPYALPLTAAMMVLALVPIVGVSPVLGGAVVYLFVNGQPLGAAFVVVWGFTSVAVTDDYLRAYLIDRESGLHSATVFLGIAGGTYLLGAIGLFVGPILLGLCKTTVEVLGDHYGVFERA
ncbi:AI-2E family transporter [Halorarum halobium]|uniref:AI-2E family transporter n=1 Tax=Halorarum halobium TaxID=3075121 RepID=UPI0028A9CA15|nr:AI-2E family transporter [Halobaculum sp. XH14]